MSTVLTIEVVPGVDGLNFTAIWCTNRTTDEPGHEVQVTSPTIYGALYALTKKIEHAAKGETE